MKKLVIVLFTSCWLFTADAQSNQEAAWPVHTFTIESLDGNFCKGCLTATFRVIDTDADTIPRYITLLQKDITSIFFIAGNQISVRGQARFERSKGSYRMGPPEYIAYVNRVPFFKAGKTN